jgi:hypothetical protein
MDVRSRAFTLIELLVVISMRTIDVRGGSRIPLFMDSVYVDLFPEDDNTPPPGG